MTLLYTIYALTALPERMELRIAHERIAGPLQLPSRSAAAAGILRRSIIVHFGDGGGGCCCLAAFAPIAAHQILGHFRPILRMTNVCLNVSWWTQSTEDRRKERKKRRGIPLIFTYSRRR